MNLNGFEGLAVTEKIVAVGVLVAAVASGLALWGPFYKAFHDASGKPGDSAFRATGLTIWICVMLLSFANLLLVSVARRERDRIEHERILEEMKRNEPPKPAAPPAPAPSQPKPIKPPAPKSARG